MDADDEPLSDERRAELERAAYRRATNEQEERDGEAARQTLLRFQPTPLARKPLAAPVPVIRSEAVAEPDGPAAAHPSSEPPPEPAFLPDDRRRVRRSLIPAAVLIVAAVGLGGYFAGRDSGATGAVAGSLTSSTLGSRPVDISKVTIKKSFTSWFVGKQRSIDAVPSSMQDGANLFDDKTTRLVLAEPDGAAYWVAEEPGADPGYCIVAIPPTKSDGGISSETDCEPTDDFLKGGATLSNDGVLVTWTATEFEIG